MRIPPLAIIIMAMYLTSFLVSASIRQSCVLMFNLFFDAVIRLAISNHHHAHRPEHILPTGWRCSMEK